MPGRTRNPGAVDDAGGPLITVGEIRARSMVRPQKVVVDEVFPDRHVRVCVSQMRPGRKLKDYLDLTAWEKDVSIVLMHSDLGGLLTKKQHGEVREGRVFLINKKRPRDIYKNVRKHIKQRVGKVLEKEGRSQKELLPPTTGKER